jgi:DNA repair exonuclease SbcCD nuclease subunit
MKYLACADLHIKAQKPLYRTDNYLEACLGKLNQIVDIANREKAIPLIAGDTFDSHRVSLGVLNDVIEILSGCEFKPIVVPGQHDMRYHSQDLYGTPLETLELADVIKVLQCHEQDGVTGVGWGAEIPEEGSDILLIHKCVTPDEPPFFLPDAISAKELAHNYKQYRVIISGDYHPCFVQKFRRANIVVNCGTMMRNSKDLIAHKPMVHLIDIGEKVDIQSIELKVKPAEEVFDLGKIEYEKQHGIEVDTTKIKQLLDADYGDHQAIKLELKDIVNKIKSDKHNQEIINEVLAHAENSGSK